METPRQKKIPDRPPQIVPGMMFGFLEVMEKEKPCRIKDISISTECKNRRLRRPGKIPGRTGRIMPDGPEKNPENGMYLK